MMSTTRTRRSTSAAVTYSEAEAAPLRASLNELRVLATREELRLGQDFTHDCNRLARTICESLSESTRPNKLQDAFRNLNGFQIIFELIRRASMVARRPESSQNGVLASYGLLQNALELLTTALQNHRVNRRFFQHRAGTDGWPTLHKELRGYLRSCSEAKQSEYDVGSKLFGQLIACSLEDETWSDVFTKINKPDGAKDHPSIDRQNGGQSSLDGTLKSALNSPILVFNPEFVSILFDLWVEQPLSEGSYPNALRSLPTVLQAIASSRTHNLLAVHEAGLLTKTLLLLKSASLPATILSELQSLAITLLNLGISKLDDAALLYENAASYSLIADTLRQALAESDGCPYIHFDLSLHGFASVELPDLGRTFPPSSSVSPGYTISVWLQIIEFDATSHTTIFGVFDSTQTCFVLVYLEKDTRNLILQTSVTSSRPSVRFKSFEFETRRWYHVCIVHRRPGMTSSSRASLFINGEFMEQVKAHFPLPPPDATIPAQDSVEVALPGQKHGAAQCFLGTPQDLAPKLGRGMSSSQWRLGSAYLLNDTLSDDLIAVHCELGPRYYGNFQDCLGSFQTYEASASLNLRNETLHPGKEEKSIIVAAIRSKASNLLPESKFLLNISPSVVVNDSDRASSDQGRIVENLSKNAVKNLRYWARGGRHSIAINGAIPSINRALLHGSGTSVLTGQPAVVVPQALDDSTWRLGGSTSIGLELLEAAKSDKAILRALDIIFATIRGSWRNSEAMERENGFGILASLLSSRLTKVHETRSPEVPNLDETSAEEGSLMLEILTKVLRFVGYNSDSPENSVINNPLAYRILLVDLDVWRSASPAVQRLYYQQFTVFSIGSKYHVFNARRLTRMRITKKWLSALKGDVFYEETLEYFLTAFRSLLNNTMTAETHRSIALHITYSVYKAKDKTGNLRHMKSNMRQAPPIFGPIIRRSTAPVTSLGMDGSDAPPPKTLNRSEVGVKMLGLYADILCQHDTSNIKKFARTVTNKWLLYLLTGEEPSIVVLATKILARVLIVNGQQYVEKFSDKTGGFTIMQHRLKKWWNLTSLWTICFSILFGRDVAQVDIQRSFDLYALMSSFPPSAITVVYPQVIPVLVALLQAGLKAIIQNQPDPVSPLKAPQSNGPLTSPLSERMTRGRATSLQNDAHSPSGLGHTREVNRSDIEAPQPDASRSHYFAEAARSMQIVTRFLADLHTSSQSFRDFVVSGTYVQELLFVLFPLIVSSDVVSPETELNSKDSKLTFEGHDVVIRSLSQNSQKSAPIVRTKSVEGTPSPEASKTKPLKRGSSYVLITSEEPLYRPSTARLEPVASPRKTGPGVTMNVSHRLVEEVLEIIVAALTDQILARKDFVGIGLFMKVPPGFQEHQAYFQSFILRNTVTNLENTVKLDQKLLWEPRVLTNLQKFCTHLDEAVFEGWFIDGADVVMDFLGELLEYLQRPDIGQLKSVRLCSEVIASMRSIISRLSLLRLSEPDESPQETRTVALLNRLTYWQTVLFVPDASQDGFLKLFCYLLYTKLVSEHEQVREVAANLWRTLLVQKPEETSSVLYRIMGSDSSQVSTGFQKILEVDNEIFLEWINEHRSELDAIFIGRLTGVWKAFTTTENRSTEDNYRARMVKRREKLRLWVKDGVARDDVLRRHEISAEHWKANIYASEHLKRQRAIQDQQDGFAFHIASWASLVRQMRRPFGLLDSDQNSKWQLDMTEGRNRMRLRMIPDQDTEQYDYKPKRSGSKTPKTLEIKSQAANGDSPLAPSPISENFKKPDDKLVDVAPTPRARNADEPDAEDDFEIVDEPDSENFEDKNRKVMRSLQRGDQVEHVHNVSRIVGLEACEGLLIIGKNAFYLVDYYFQRSDGEIVDVWQAPADERDSYMQMIAGRQAGSSVTKSADGIHKTRNWRWEDVLSISRRRFLFRDVALEVFFLDGQSYLLTVLEPKLRDEVYHKLLSKAHTASGLASASPEDLWRVESLRSAEDNPQSLGSRFTNVFTQGNANPATKKWVKGEISNFQYLMLVNTMAGRTLNDLTQYPVFPWVLADYTSEELDLTNPRSFRDLTKPMGAQTPDRQMEFMERYQSFAEMGDQNAPPFHYGTHYSSAMIVTGYLIRLQPFVQSYLLLQGGSFDHPDRLFYSVEKAWSSASRENMADVRELIPEFFYLPEMFVNGNRYDFGMRQGSGGAIDNVILPPWAKGDPKVFVAKHREALESDYVSVHLHQWIDLVFGHRQRGEAALEATNIFHHLSYKGARNLDEITDPVERLATIGIIHNFGQTPHQVFQRAHPTKEIVKVNPKRLDLLAETLTRLPLTLLETKDRIATLLYSERRERLLCSGPLRLNVPPLFDKYVEWGFIDGSLRFYQTDNNKLVGIFEHVHQSQLCAATFADSNTLVTAGNDCVISVWAVTCSPKAVDLLPKGSFFGHRAPITTLAVAKSFSSLLSTAADGVVLLWDLNRLELIRIIAQGAPVECASINDVTGTILLCRGQEATLYTLNGELLLEQHACVEGDEIITSCAFFQGSGNEFLTRNLIFTGHRHGVVNIWNMTIHDGRFMLEHVKRMNHIDSSSFNISSTITAILPTAQVVYTGDEDGRVYEWNCIQRQ